jgi:surface protein
MKLGLGIALNRRGAAGGAAAPPTDFRIVVKTDNAGVSNNDQFQFTGALGDYDVEVYDATGTTLQETITGLSDAATITIAAGAGTYELRVFAAATNGFNRIQFNNGGDKAKLLEVRNWGDIAWSTMEDAFYGCSNATSITSFGSPDLSSVTNFGSFARDCSSLTTLDVSSWDTSSVTFFGAFALNCSSLTALDVSSWDTSSVTSFGSFARDCSSLTTLDVSSWDTSSVTNFGSFANNCSSLTALDVSSWDTSSVTDFGFFARDCSSLTDITGVDNFNISSVTNFNSFLQGTTLPTARYDQLLINYEAQAPNSGLNFHGGNSQYTLGGAAETARTSLATTYSWTITDGGGV